MKKLTERELGRLHQLLMQLAETTTDPYVASRAEGLAHDMLIDRH